MPLAPRAGARSWVVGGIGARVLVAQVAMVLACTSPPPVTPTAMPPTSAPSPPSATAPSPSPSVAPTVSPSILPTDPPVPTPSVSPSASPIVGTFIEVLRDDMSDPRSGFPTVDDETQRVTYDAGMLRLDLKLPGRATWTTRGFGDWPLADVAGSFELREETGTGFYGLTCGVDRDDFYAGVIASDGTALLLRVVDGTATRLAQQFSAITPVPVGGSLDLELSCVGVDAAGTTGVSLTSSGRVLATAADPEGFLSLRRAGFYAESGPDSEAFSILSDDFVVTVGLVADPGTEPSASPSLTGDPDADALAEHVPESLRGGCRKVVLPGFDAFVAIDCGTGEVPMAYFLQYATETDMLADYDGLVEEHPEASGSDCAVGPGEGPYTVDAVEVGRLLCFASPGAAFVWTDVRIEVMGHARRADASFRDLYDWWLQAGPVP